MKLNEGDVMVLSDLDIEKLHSTCLLILCEIDRICRKNGIEYTLEGGTLIGAVREHGFIPWDDDADVSMSRAEYEKFFNACKDDLDTGSFFLQEHRTDPEYPWGYSKMRMNGTSLVQVGQEKLKFRDGIFVDIFIYDNVPDGYILRRLHFASCFCIRKCQFSLVAKDTATNIGLRTLYRMMNLIPKRWLFSSLDYLAQKTNKKRTELMRHYTFPYFRKECMYGLPSVCFDEYIDADFEGKKFRIVKNYDSFLKLKYGDYMTPPKTSEITHYPVSRIKFREE